MIEHAGWRVGPERLADVARPSAESVAMNGMPHADVGAILHLHADGTVLIGSSRQPWITPEPEDAGVPQRLLRAGIRLAPSLGDATVVSTWWGLRPITPDERPMVGTVRDGLVVATGHGSEGVILGAGTAQLVASIVLGGAPPFDPVPFDPFRFDGLRRSPQRSAASRPARSMIGSTRSTGIANSVFPSRPTVVSAASSAFTTASSVASTVAANSSPNNQGSPGRASATARTSTTVSMARTWMRFAVENASICSPEPFEAVEPVRASPMPARCAMRRS